jgi:hypothetical protein
MKVAALDLCGDRSYQQALDPWAGSGLLLSTLVEAGRARKGFGVVENERDHILARATSAGLDIEWVLSDPMQSLRTSKRQFDLVVSSFPIGTQKKTMLIPDQFGKERAVSDEIGKLALLESSRRLELGGMGIFIASRFDASSHENGVYHALSDFGLRLDAFFAMPENSFIPHSSVPSGIAIVRRGEGPGVFVGRFSGDTRRDSILLQNYRANRPSNEFGLGRIIPPREFRGWASLDANEKVRVRSSRIGYPETTVKELAVSVDLAVDGRFPETPNSLFVPAIGKGPAKSSQAELTMKAQNYVQLSLDPNKASAPFVAEFLNSPLGTALREEMQTGFIPRLTKRSIRDMRLYLPPLSRQAEILEAQSQLRALKGDLQTLESQLWSEPRKCDRISQQIARYTREESFSEWLDRLPFPLASILWTYQTAGEEQGKRCEHLLHFFEALAQFMATILLSALESNEAMLMVEKEKIARALESQHLTLKRGTFGTWKCIYEVLAKSFRTQLASNEDSGSVRRILCCDDDGVLSMLVSSDLVGVMQRCNGYRNSWQGHSGVVGQREATNRHQILEQELSKVREAFGNAWTRYQLVLPSQSTFSNGVYKYTLYRVTGRSTPFEQFGASLIQPLEDGQLHLLAEDERVALRLIPLVRVMRSPVTAENACYFYNRQQEDGVPGSSKIKLRSLTPKAFYPKMCSARTIQSTHSHSGPTILSDNRRSAPVERDSRPGKE